jgi:hypothetical protein
MAPQSGIQSASRPEILKKAFKLSAQDAIDFGCDHVVIATGAQWTRQVLDTNAYLCICTEF